MKSRRLVAWLALLLVGWGTTLLRPEEAAAAKKAYEDKRLGFRLKIDDSFTQSPPKLTPDTAYIVGEWYQDKAKFDSYQLRPEFRVMWFVTPKEAATAEKAPSAEKPDPSKDIEGFLRAMRDEMRYHSVDEALEDWFQGNTHLFAAQPSIKDLFAKASADRTTGKIAFQSFEVNAPDKKKDRDAPHGYAYAAKLTIDRPNETIEVGFLGFCAVDYVKQFRKEFPAMVRSFEELKDATDSRNEDAQVGLSQNRDERREQIKKTKVIKGWKFEETKNYFLLYSEELDSKLAKSIAVQLEAIRAQIYEVLFPPDKPIEAVSIVRICKDRTQYMGYGAPGGSAGYWSPYEEELVFYEDKPKEDSLRVLYHEAFHQYIHYSVGDFAPHSWFNEGHGDYFAGHNYSAAGKFTRDVFQWRVTAAKEFKRHAKRPPLKEWVKWTQAQYYGANEMRIDGSLNYAGGWSFVYFLRTTRNPEYQKILPRYFDTLKGTISRQRALDEAFRKELEEWEKKSESDPDFADPRPERKQDPYASNPLPHAIQVAYEGIDWDKLEKDWLAADY